MAKFILTGGIVVKTGELGDASMISMAFNQFC